MHWRAVARPTPPRPPVPPGVTFGHSELLGQFRESAWFTELAEELESRNWPRSSEYHFDPFRSENNSIEWTVVTNRVDSVNSVDISYMDMSEVSELYSCQVFKYWNGKLQNVNISKYPWPLDGIIICITLVTVSTCFLAVCTFVSSLSFKYTTKFSLPKMRVWMGGSQIL